MCQSDSDSSPEKRSSGSSKTGESWSKESLVSISWRRFRMLKRGRRKKQIVKLQTPRRSRAHYNDILLMAALRPSDLSRPSHRISTRIRLSYPLSKHTRSSSRTCPAQTLRLQLPFSMCLLQEGPDVSIPWASRRSISLLAGEADWANPKHPQSSRCPVPTSLRRAAGASGVGSLNPRNPW